MSATGAPETTPTPPTGWLSGWWGSSTKQEPKTELLEIPVFVPDTTLARSTTAVECALRIASLEVQIGAEQHVESKGKMQRQLAKKVVEFAMKTFV